MRPPELKLSTPAHTKHPGGYLEFESRVTAGLYLLHDSTHAGRPIYVHEEVRATCSAALALPLRCPSAAVPLPLCCLSAALALPFQCLSFAFTA